MKVDVWRGLLSLWPDKLGMARNYCMCVHGDEIHSADSKHECRTVNDAAKVQVLKAMQGTLMHKVPVQTLFIRC